MACCCTKVAHPFETSPTSGVRQRRSLLLVSFSILARINHIHLSVWETRLSRTRNPRNQAMDWTGPNAAVAAGNALLDKRIGENVGDIAKHVFQLAQSLRSVDGTDTGLTGFDMEFAVRTAPTRISAFLHDAHILQADHLHISNPCVSLR